MHRANCGQVLFDDRFHGASSFRDVASQATNKTNVIRRVDENFDVELFEQARVDENQNALDDHNRLGFDRARFVQTVVSFEIVEGQFDGLAGFQSADMVNQKIVLKAV